jgi:hypothetical protein
VGQSALIALPKQKGDRLLAPLCIYVGDLPAGKIETRDFADVDYWLRARLILSHQHVNSGPEGQVVFIDYPAKNIN